MKKILSFIRKLYELVRTTCYSEKVSCINKKHYTDYVENKSFEELFYNVFYLLNRIESNLGATIESIFSDYATGDEGQIKSIIMNQSMNDSRISASFEHKRRFVLRIIDWIKFYSSKNDIDFDYVKYKEVLSELQRLCKLRNYIAHEWISSNKIDLVIKFRSSREVPGKDETIDLKELVIRLCNALDETSGWRIQIYNNLHKVVVSDKRINAHLDIKDIY